MLSCSSIHALISQVWEFCLKTYFLSVTRSWSNFCFFFLFQSLGHVWVSDPVSYNLCRWQRKVKFQSPVYGDYISQPHSQNQKYALQCATVLKCYSFPALDLRFFFPAIFFGESLRSTSPDPFLSNEWI